jgi:hypothetical protein
MIVGHPIRVRPVVTCGKSQKVFGQSALGGLSGGGALRSASERTIETTR